MSKKKPPRKSNQALWWVAGAAVVVVGALIGISQLGGNKSSGTAKSDAEVHAVRNVKGSPTAKVKLVKYSDFL